MGMAGDSLGLEGWLQGLDASKLLIALLPVWILGAFIGMLVRVSDRVGMQCYNRSAC